MICCTKHHSNYFTSCSDMNIPPPLWMVYFQNLALHTFMFTYSKQCMSWRSFVQPCIHTNCFGDVNVKNFFIFILYEKVALKVWSVNVKVKNFLLRLSILLQCLSTVIPLRNCISDSCNSQKNLIQYTCLFTFINVLQILIPLSLRQVPK